MHMSYTLIKYQHVKLLTCSGQWLLYSVQPLTLLLLLLLLLLVLLFCFVQCLIITPGGYGRLGHASQDDELLPRVISTFERITHMTIQ
jgi:hypothetical protein